MTRETKIGLLVGLAFIIVIGILLSDHLSSSTEPPPATLAGAGSNVMQTVNTPGVSAAAQPITAPQVQPLAPVPTSADLTAQSQSPAVQIVQVGPGASPQDSPLTIQARPQDQMLTPMVEPATQNPASDAPLITHVAPAAAPESLASAAQRYGESLVALDPSGRPAVATALPSWSQALSGMREYQAQPGDSVSRMAMQFFGANTKANRDLIIRANPALQKDPNRVIVGQTYLIPAPGSTSGVSGAGPHPASGAGAVSATEYWYTVKEGDSLWKIANDQLGKPSAVAAIKELNKDALRGEDTVYVGMKLKLPGKPLAQAR